MSYENVLQIYWLKNFFFGGQLFSFSYSIISLINILPGFSRAFFFTLVKRFELTFVKYQPELLMEDCQILSRKVIISPLNVILSQISSVNALLPTVLQLCIIRLYLIKSHRGRCHAIGKPTRGQRTWSNAWNAYNVNKTLRLFISETKVKLQAQFKPDKKKINYKQVRKKYAPTKIRIKSAKPKKKKTFWF